MSRRATLAWGSAAMFLFAVGIVLSPPPMSPQQMRADGKHPAFRPWALATGPAGAFAFLSIGLGGLAALEATRGWNSWRAGN